MASPAAAQTLPFGSGADLLTLDAANDVLGGDFLARINMDLRERPGWSYGAGSGISQNEGGTLFTIQAPVQADRTGESIAEGLSRFAAF